MDANYFWSPSTLSFYHAALCSAYKKSGSFPDDAAPVADDVFEAYGLTQPPAGMTRGVDSNGLPAWIQKQS